MKKKIIIVLVSVISFFLLIFIAVPFLINNNPREETDNKINNREIVNVMSSIEKLEAEVFLNRDNLYENYTQNYAIKIPENYKYDKGIGKYSSSQFYNEDLGFVVAINVGEANFGSNIKREQSNEIIKKFSNELKNDNSLGKIFEQSLIEKGFNNPKLISNKVSNYNNRLFLRLNFKATRVSDNQEYPVLIANFATFYKNSAYHFQFVSYEKESSEKWNAEIQKSMSNVMISEYITKKN